MHNRAKNSDIQQNDLQKEKKYALETGCHV